MNIDNAALKQWKKSEISLNNHKLYIQTKMGKGRKYPITLIDLLYVSNFKGGNGTINEEESFVNLKLQKYSEIFKEIDDHFESKKLSNLEEYQIKMLEKYIQIIFNLSKEKEYHIDGFGHSRLSALLHVYFPNLIPIIDRRVLNGLGLLDDKNYDSNGQVINIGSHYNYNFLKEISDKCKESSKSIRQIDKDLFIIKMPEKK